MIELFDNTKADEWDSFVMKRSENGNFLQTRRFLGYHPEGRFEDASVMYRDGKGNLRAVIPAAKQEGVNGLRMVSHPGSTYGGIVCDGKSLSAKRLQPIIEELEECAQSCGFSEIDLRLPPSFLWSKGAALVEYMLRLDGFECLTELTTYIDYSLYGDNTLKRLSQGKRTNVNNCKKEGLEFVQLCSVDDVRMLHQLLSANLAKYGVEPVHTIDEIWELYSSRLAGETELLGVLDDGELVAAGWVFLFKNRSAAHTQYLCADESFSRLSPMSFLYYSVIERYRMLGYKYVSWGVSTEDSGRILNWGLTDSKESYGSLHDVQRRFLKQLR